MALTEQAGQLAQVEQKREENANQQNGGISAVDEAAGVPLA